MEDDLWNLLRALGDLLTEFLRVLGDLLTEFLRGLPTLRLETLRFFRIRLLLLGAFLELRLEGCFLILLSLLEDRLEGRFRIGLRLLIAFLGICLIRSLDLPFRTRLGFLRDLIP